MKQKKLLFLSWLLWPMLISLASAQIPTVSLTWVNVETQQDLSTLAESPVLDLNVWGVEKVSLRAESIFPWAKSMKFTLSGPLTHEQVVNQAPYALFGSDEEGNYLWQALPDGHYELIINVFTEENAQGFAITSHAASFEVKNAPDQGSTWKLVWQDQFSVQRTQRIFASSSYVYDREEFKSITETAVDSEGNLLILGGSWYIADGNSSSYSARLYRYPPERDKEETIFSVVASGKTDSYASRLILDPWDNIYTLVSAYPDRNTSLITKPNNVSLPVGVSLVKHNPDGEFQWFQLLRKFDDSDERILDVKVDEAGIVEVTKKIGDQTFLIRYDGDGNLLSETPLSEAPSGAEPSNVDDPPPGQLLGYLPNGDAYVLRTDGVGTDLEPGEGVVPAEGNGVIVHYTRNNQLYPPFFKGITYDEYEFEGIRLQDREPVSRDKNITVHTSSTNVDRVEFKLVRNSGDGLDYHYEHTDTKVPYTLIAEDDSETLISAGEYELTAVIYDLAGRANDTLTKSFAIKIGDYYHDTYLTNANTGENIAFLRWDLYHTFDLAEVGRALTITGDISGNKHAAQSHGFILRDEQGEVIWDYVDNEIPFALFGNEANGDYKPWNPALGKYTLEGTAYFLKNAQGAFTDFVLQFEITDSNLSVAASEGSSTELVSFQTYPNRSQGLVKLEVILAKAQSARLEIYNFQGNCVHQQAFRGNLNTEIDLSSFGNGLYLARIVSGQGTITRRILID